MSKLNSTRKSSTLKTNQVTVGENAGQVTDMAAAQSSIALLRRAVLANLLWENIAYMDGKSVTEQIKALIPQCDPMDVANLTIEARTMQKLRHTPLFLTVEMCKHDATRPYVKDVLPKIITRADMLTDFMALYWADGKCPICNAAKKGLAEAFHNFNEYKFAKYDRNAEIKLRDVMFMVRPKPETPLEAELYKKIADRTLETPETWEVLLSMAHTPEEKAAVWTKLITEGKIGGKAMLMNIRNMQDAGVPRPVIEEGLKNLNGTMLLPLDFLKAMRMSKGFDREIEDAMLMTYQNLPKLPGKTLFIIDVSGSMGSITSSGSVFSRLDQACSMAMLAANQCTDFELVCTAGSDGELREEQIRIEYPSKGFKLFDEIQNTRLTVGGGGIFTYQCLEKLRKELGNKIHDYDRIIVFSDSADIDVSSWGSPNRDKKPRPFGKYNYICDVSCHTHGIAYNGVWTAEISGWSEHFLTYIAAYEGLENTFAE
ncbi:MAG: TROVE domain-containing protein [Methanobrevibacter sp.]|nr:TROVE domain-containing protein [Methanobrevibacter sp.]